jgi:lincosamide nucleotidyltransferase A/C/D/E
MDMSADAVVALLDALEDRGVAVWLDGGWGLDALLGEQTRPHDDLDVIIALHDVPRLQDTLQRLGYSLVRGRPPMSFEMTDDEGRQVDVHPVVFNDKGDGVYQMEDRQWPYPAEGFAGVGSVLGRRVRCLTPEVQVLCHAGYELDADDVRDLRALRERFQVELPEAAQGPCQQAGCGMPGGVSWPSDRASR